MRSPGRRAVRMTTTVPSTSRTNAAAMKAVADPARTKRKPATTIQTISRARRGAPAARRTPNTMTATSMTAASRSALPKTPWMRPPSKRLSRDQYSIGSMRCEGTTKPGSRGPRTSTETATSNSSDRPTTHLAAEATARTTSRQVSTAPTNSPWKVVMTRSSRVRTDARGHALHESEAVAHAT